MTLFLIIACIGYIFIAWANRPLSITLLIACLPVYQIRFEVLGIPMTLLEAFIILLTLVWLVQTVRTQRRIDVPYAWAVGAFVLAGTIAMIVSVDVRAGLGLWKAYIIEPVFVYVVYMNTIRTEKDQRQIHWAFIVLLLLVGAGALLQAVGWMQIPEPYASEIPRRVTSVYPFPTAIGKIADQLIVFSLTFVVFAWSALRAQLRRRLFGFLLAGGIGIASLFLSVNRGALLGVLASIFLFALLSRRRMIVLSLCAVACAALLFVPVVHTEIEKVFTRTDTSTDVRVVMWQGTWRLIMHHPITGAGLGGFPTLYNEYRDASHVELFPNPDSLYLTLWSEMGLYGVLAFFWIFGIWARSAWRAIHTSPSGSYRWLLGVAASAVLIAFLVHGVVDTPYFKNDLAVFFWVFFAFVVQNERNKNQHRLA